MRASIPYATEIASTEHYGRRSTDVVNGAEAAEAASETERVGFFARLFGR